MVSQFLETISALGVFPATLGPEGVRVPPSLSYWLLPAHPLPVSLTLYSPPQSAVALVLCSLRKYWFVGSLPVPRSPQETPKDATGLP